MMPWPSHEANLSSSCKKSVEDWEGQFDRMQQRWRLASRRSEGDETWVANVSDLICYAIVAAKETLNIQ